MMTTPRSGRPQRLLLLFSLLACAACLAPGAVLADQADGASGRASWLLDRMTDGDRSALGGRDLQKDEFGSGFAVADEEESSGSFDRSPALMLASAIVPGAGEILMGNWKRGAVLVAADAYCWYKAKDAKDEGEELEDEFYAFADDHWNEERLYWGYSAFEGDPNWRSVGLTYFDLSDEEGNPISSMSSIDDLEYLSLWVSKEDDRREYYENLGKWDQFVFGWDDFLNPNNPPAGIEYSPDLTLSDLRQPWTSYNREKYRDMREASNDAFKRRDRYLYVNLGLRVFSVLQVAYLQGWLGGGPRDKIEVAGREVRILAAPDQRGQGTLAAQFSF